VLEWTLHTPGIDMQREC